MAIIAKKPESSFTPAPEGLHHAVCVDVVDLGIVPSSFGDKHKVRIVWQIEEENIETRRRFEARKQFNLSLHEKATLRKDLESWRGRKFTDDELKGFDLEKLIAANCQIQVVHDIGEDASIWANVQAVVPAPKNVAKLAPLDYTRMKDRPMERGNGQSPKPITDEDIPF
jgi:hypothetical protein